MMKRYRCVDALLHICLGGLVAGCGDSTPPPKGDVRPTIDQKVADLGVKDKAKPDAPVDGPLADKPLADKPLVDQPAVDGPKVDGPKVDGPKVDGPKVDGPKVDGPKVDGPKGDVKPPADTKPTADLCIGIGCPCTTSAVCGTGGKCCNSTCVTGNCCATADCPTGQVCNSNTCGACATSAECGAGSACCPGAGGVKGCVVGNCCTSAECQGGQGCIANVCRDLCGVTTPCPTGAKCCANACYVGNCCSNADCTNGQACVKNVCSACTADIQCGLGEICDGGKCITGCNGSVTCTTGELCCTAQSTNCKPGTLGCKGSCTPGNCCSNADCGGGQVCTADHVCRAPCSTSADCSVGGHCCTGYCYNTPCVTTLAGSGLMGAPDAPIATALVNGVRGMVTDSAGNLYFTEWHGASSQVRLLNVSTAKIGPVAAGTVGRVAGGRWGCKPGPALEAEIRTPWGLARDTAGNIYIADADCAVIWKLSADLSTVTQFAGERDNHAVVDGTGTNARFHRPRGITYGVDGNLYVSEWEQHWIRQVSLAGVVKKVAGTGTAGELDGPALQAQLYTPAGLTMDSGGTLFVGDWETGAVRRVTGLAGANPQVSTIISPAAPPPPPSPTYGYAANATLSIASGSTLYINFWNNGVWRLTPPATGTEYTATKIATGSSIMSNVIDPTASFLWLGGWVHDGTTSYANTISKFDITGGTVTQTIGTPGMQGVIDGPGAGASFTTYGGGSIATDPGGNVWFAEYHGMRVRKISPSGVVTSYGSGRQGDSAGTATTANIGCYPAAITVVGTNVYMANRYCSRRIMKIDTTTGNVTQQGQLCNLTGGSSSSCVYASWWGGMVADAAGNLYVGVTDQDGGVGTLRAIVKIPNLGAGTPSFFAGTPAPSSTGCADGPLNTGRFSVPYGMAIDSGGYIYVADGGCGVRKVAPDGTISTLTNKWNPVGIAISPASAGPQKLYVSNGNRIFTVDRLTGADAFLAGEANITWDSHFADGELAKAKFRGPYSMATNAAGDLFVMDAYNSRIRVVYP
jgi:sugar lactone lactonase YvrE